MGSCSDNRGRTAGRNCCCPACNSIRPGYCCRCISKYLCIAFYPDEQPNAFAESEVSVIGGGQYYGGLQVDGGDGLWVALVKGETCCYWRFVYIPTYIEPLTPPLFLTVEQVNNLAFNIWVPAEDCEDKESYWTGGASSPQRDIENLGIPCDWIHREEGEDDQDIEIVIPNAFYGAGFGFFGTYVIKRGRKLMVPYGKVSEEPGCRCYKFLCEGCSCVPECACIRWGVDYYEDNPDFGDPGEEEFILIGGDERVLPSCYDPEVGVNGYGGWQATFPIDPNDLCGLSKDVIVEIVPDEETNACIMVIDGDVGADDPSFDCEEIEQHWTEEVTDDPEYPLIIKTVSFLTDNCTGDCDRSCCSSLPDELLMIVEGENQDGSICTEGDIELILTKTKCGGSAYSYGPTASVPFNCDGTDEAGEEGTGTIEVQFSCQGCVYNGLPDHGTCECICDELGTLTDGCHLINLIKLTNFGSHTTIGNQSNVNSECGNHPVFGPTYSTCDPIYARFRIPVSGIGADCCEVWNITITNVP